MRAPLTLLVVFAASLAGCSVSSNTTSVVNAGDIPAAKYHNILVYVENVGDVEHLKAEMLLAQSLEHEGVHASASVTLFRSQDLDDNAKGTFIREHGFDAVLFVTVLQEVQADEPAPNVTYDGKQFHATTAVGPLQVPLVFDDGSSLNPYQLNSDGTIVRPTLTLMLRSEIQDVWSAKQIWVADTSASISAKYGTMHDVFEEAAKQIVEKIRADHVI